MTERRLFPYHRPMVEGWPRWVLYLVVAGLGAAPFVLAAVVG